MIQNGTSGRPSSLPILPNRYDFQVAQGKYKQFTIVKNLMKATDTVILRVMRCRQRRIKYSSVQYLLSNWS